MRPSRGSSIAGLALAMAAAAGVSTVSAPPAPTVTRTLVLQDAQGRQATVPAATTRTPAQQSLFRRLLMSGYRVYRQPRYPKHAGWTNARYQRAARKRRNQAKNRRAHRG